MAATVVKQQKLHRVAQRWRAECAECAWKGTLKRRADDARQDVIRHNQKEHLDV